MEWEACASVSNNPMAQFRPTERHNHSELWILTNVTIKGSRAYYHTYVLSQTFALQEQERFSFFTTTHEKDGGLLALPGFFAGERSFTNRTGSGSSLFSDVDSTSLTRSHAINDNTIYITTPGTNEVDGLNSATRICLDDQCNLLHETVNGFIRSNGTIIRNFASEILYSRVNSAEEWRSMILEEYDRLAIPPSARITPVDDPCSLSICPSEEEWCEFDPNCSESPYQEPRGSLRPEVIAVIDVLAAVLLILGFFLLHRWLVKRQARRNRAVFASRIAETIQLETSVNALSPAALAEEFRRIDKQARDGKLSKDELWAFVCSGKAGDLSRKDFDALFAAIDLNKNGEVDFLSIVLSWANVRRRSTMLFVVKLLKRQLLDVYPRCLRRLY